MRSNYTIRWLAPEDLGDFINLEEADPGVRVFFFLPHIMTDMEISERFFVGLFEGEELVGLCSLGYDTTHEDAGILSNVYVNSHKRGKGYGRALVKGAIQKAAEKHFSELYIDLPDSEFVDMCAKFGFKPCEEDVFGWSMKIDLEQTINGG